MNPRAKRNGAPASARPSPKSIRGRRVRTLDAQGDQILIDAGGAQLFVPRTGCPELLKVGMARITWRYGDASQPAMSVVTHFAHLRFSIESIMAQRDTRSAQERRLTADVEHACEAVTSGCALQLGLHRVDLNLVIFVERARPQTRWQRLLGNPIV